MKFRLGTKVTGARKGNDGVTLSMEPAKGGAAEELKADIVLLSIGRRPTPRARSGRGRRGDWTNAAG